MSRLGIANTAAVIVAVALALVAASFRASVPVAALPVVHAPSIEVIALRDGRRALRDATGELIELKPYRRILSASMLGDRLLHELAEPERVIGVTTYGRTRSPWAYQQSDKPALAGVDDLETALSLRPDLVVMNSLGDTARVARIRERGIAVFDLGQMNGAATLVRDIHVVAHLVGHPERGERFAAAWQHRFASVSASLGTRPRKRAMYLTAYGGKLFGGSRNTSYGDVIVAAGLVDAAAATFEGWPQYSLEDVLRLDPDVIVTKPGMRVALCRMAGFERLNACRATAGIIEIDDGLLDDPGPAMLDTAELIARTAYPDAK